LTANGVSVSLTLHVLVEGEEHVQY
jgi:hypothetical protein